MAYENFISDVEIRKLVKEREEYLCLAHHCTREYEGSVKELGDSVTVFGMARPTIYKLNAKGEYVADAVGKGSVAGSGKDVIHKGIPEAEELSTWKKTIYIRQISLFNYKVGDIDKQQSSIKNIIGTSRTTSAQDMAAAQDEYIRDVIAGTANCKLSVNGFDGKFKVTTEKNGDGKINVCYLLDEIRQKLRYNKVRDTEKLYAECSPAFLRALKTSLKYVDTNNSKLVRGVDCFTYDGIEFYSLPLMTKAETDYLIVRTGNSVATINPLTHVEPYRIQEGFADCIKGFDLYDAAVIDEKGCLFAEIDRTAYEW
jgi:hypothetical protein